MKKDFFVFVFILVFSIAIISLLKFPVPRAIDNPPGMHQFYGSVSYANGSLMPDGTIVKALVNNETKVSVLTSGGKYGYNPVFIVEDAADGSVVEFYVNNNKVSEYVFKNFELIELNLQLSICGDSFCSSSESCSSCSQDCGVCSQPTQPATSSGSGGGGGGVGIPVSQTYIVSSSDLITGYSRDLSVNDKFQFILNGTHYSKLSQIRGDEISMVIGSENVVIDLGGEDLVDINSDGKADISLKLNSISGSKANVKIQAVYNNENYGVVPGCAANWSCGSWSICINSKKMRNCVDVNNCYNLENKPAEVESCYEIRSYIMVGVIIILILGIIVVIAIIVKVLFMGKKDKKTLLMEKINTRL